jgi:hypothetical protein
LPYYKDQKAADNLLDNSYNINKADYYKREAALRTDKLTFMDLGSGLATAATTIFLFLLFVRVKTWGDFKKIKSPGKTIILILSNIAWLVLIPGTFWYYSFRIERGDYPPFADSIAIPIIETISTILVGLLPLNVFILLTSIRANLPTQVFIKADNYKRTPILWEIFFAFWLFINLLFLIDFVADGDKVSIPINLFFTFVLLSLRAGQISKYKKREENA